MGQSIITTFTNALSGFASGVSSTVISTFNSLFVGAEGGLTDLAVYGLTFSALALVIGICRLFTRKAG